MRSRYTIPPWKNAPFVRLMIPLFAGVIMQFYIKPGFEIILTAGASAVLLYFLLFFFNLGKRYKLRRLQGFLIQLIICMAGSWFAWSKDVRHDKNWFGHFYTNAHSLIVTIDEPLVKKEKSYKADGAINSVIDSDQHRIATGRLILYFTDTMPTLQYGDKILVRKTLQPIRNTGNPAAFDYARYAGFQQKFHTVFLRPQDYAVLPQKNVNLFSEFIFNSRKQIIGMLQAYVSKEKSVLGIAEALLIGYKQDLDKDLVQAYSNTGVVHIIAISGLHLGLIYVMLTWLMNVLPLIRRYETVKVVVILTSLWLFSILTGSSASVLRSALMFSCILVGKTYFKQSSVYNAIAASAFMLVCYDPFMLWDVGFQLSYLAVLGIVWLQRPILHLIYVKNKWLHKVWSMVAVTLAAQIAAFPVCIYYFHQFPNAFLLTNLVAVPLSTLILFAEILLLCFSWMDAVAVFMGKAVSLLIELMNLVIISCNKIPWSVTDNIYATIYTTFTLYFIVIFGAAWLMYRYTFLLKFFLVSTSLFAVLHLYADLKSRRQRKVIVYNVSRSQAIDFINGNAYFFVGDSALQPGNFQHSFHIRSARISFQSTDPDPQMVYDVAKGIVNFNGWQICIIQTGIAFKPIIQKIKIDVLIISHNPTLKITGLVTALKPELIVFDASNSLWKIEEWKKECSALFLPFHSVPEQGAFVTDIQ